MARIGAFNTLTICKIVDFGVYLDGGNLGEILLPKKQLTHSPSIGSNLNVFIYLDSKDRVIATHKTPYAQVGEFAYLSVVAVNKVGAFLDWGLEKDLLLPFSEQKQPLTVGKRYLVFIYLDRIKQRITASAKIDKFLDQVTANYQAGESVELIIAARTDLGFKAIVNHRHWGILYHQDLLKPLAIGSTTKGLIKKIRPDGKIDLTLTKPAAEQRDTLSQQILKELQQANGYLPINDKSSPESIYEQFNVSKRIFKQTIGGLFKQRLISIEDQGIRLVVTDGKP